MQLEPTADRLIIEPTHPEKTTKTGLFLPTSADGEKPMEGKVLSVGKDVYEVKEGDGVIFAKYSPVAIKLEGKEYYIVEERDILSVIK